jgi:thioredoxin reductase (NADPH)
MVAAAPAPERTDVLVVGAGPCGLAAAIALGRAGLDALVVDRGPLVSSIASYPTYLTFFSTAEKISIGGIPFVTGGDKPTRREALAYYRLVAEHFALRLRLYETVTTIRRDDAGFIAETSGRHGASRTIRAAATVVATGYFGTPNMLGVPGESLPHVTHLFREGHEAFGRDAVVVGGGNSAVEAAVELYRARARTTLVHFGDGPDRNVKPWVLPDFENRVKEGSIRAMWGSRVLEIRADSLRLATPDGERTIPAEHLYLLTGFTPSTTLLERLGATVNRETGIPVHDPGTMETDVRGLFVAGVLTAGYDANKVFIENGRDHGDRIASALGDRTAPRRSDAAERRHGDRLGSGDRGPGTGIDAAAP